MAIHKIEIVYDDQVKSMQVNAPLLDKPLCFQMLGDAIKVLGQHQADNKLMIPNGTLPNLRRNG